MKLASFLLLVVVFVFDFQLRITLCGGTNSMESVPDLQKSMYSIVDGYPCVRLLNLSGEIGCSNPGRGKVVAPVVRFKSANKLAQVSTILVTMDDIQSFFTRVASDSSFSRNVGGVLVESGPQTQTKLNGFSPDSMFPQVGFAPYKNFSYIWNMDGSGILWNAYYFPVFLLSESSTVALQKVVAENEKSRKPYAANVAEFDLVMETTKSGTHDSESCLKEGTCRPLGGYSVWTSLPPISVSKTAQSKPIILTIASMDSASFFRDKSFGADSPISGMISLMAAVDALSHVDGLDMLSKQLAFVVFTGENWGYLGSRRFLQELDLESESVKGLNSSLIEMVLEIGSVGRGFNQGINSFFAHTAGVSSVTTEIWRALKHAEDSLGSKQTRVSLASKSNPGIPPSSMMTFMRKNSLASGIVLEDFDSVFTNKFYNSHLDDISNVNSSAIVAAASLIARTLYILGNGNSNVSSPTLDLINVNASLVNELMGCLLSCEPGLSCEIVKSYIDPNSICPSNYVGVVPEEPTSKPRFANDISRFLWNFLADRTSVTRKNSASDCSKDCSTDDQVCIGAEANGKGICVSSTTRYVPAYSTRLKFESWTWNLLPLNSTDSLGALDPVWTESNWNTIEVRVYKVQDSAYDRLVLLGGITVTVLTYILVVIVRAFITKALKRD